MNTSKKRFAVAAGFIILLALTAWLLVSQFGWAFAGHVLFGLTIGLMIGMTKSSIVSTALPLLFTFAGGSIVALSIGDKRTPEQLEILGSQLAGFGIGTSAGLLIGIALRSLARVNRRIVTNQLPIAAADGHLISKPPVKCVVRRRTILSRQEWQQIHAVEFPIGLHFGPCRRQHGRQDIELDHRLFVHFAGGQFPFPTHDKGNVDTAIERRSF